MLCTNNDIVMHVLPITAKHTHKHTHRETKFPIDSHFFWFSYKTFIMTTVHSITFAHTLGI